MIGAVGEMQDYNLFSLSVSMRHSKNVVNSRNEMMLESYNLTLSIEVMTT
jgi:hypothetical protein